MNIQKIGQPKIVMQNPESKHNYFAWPSVARLQNGKIAVVASGFRLRHLCPFGKAVIAYSEDEGETYTQPAPVIDTVLDDRDSGIVPFGEKQVMVTSFNNTVEDQRVFASWNPGVKDEPYILAYLDTITQEEQDAVIGSTFRISNDCGVTFGPLHRSPVTSPHGPAVLKDGSLLWVGCAFAGSKKENPIEAHKIYPDGSTEYVGHIENVAIEGMELGSYEPHALVLEDGTILVHIRVQDAHSEKFYTIFQSESMDNGKTWSQPRRILSMLGGAPAHLMQHSSGILISTYGFRGIPYGANPCGIRCMFSADNGATWETPDDFLYESNLGPDLGYPATVELTDGSLLTVFYAGTEPGGPTVIKQQKWHLVR